MKNARLIQGTVEYKVFLSVLIDEDMEDYEIKEILSDLAREELDSSDEDIEIENDVDVIIGEETFKKYNNGTVGDDDWTEIITENRNNKNSL